MTAPALTPRPLAIDLCCGLGGWTEGALAEGYDVIGFDTERHVYGGHAYPAQLVLQDITTLHGSQFRHAALIVASPPCQGYSYRAMPWKRAKALPPPDNTLFDTCFRIQREASAAAGHHIPLVVENVRGAQKWVGRAQWHYGSYYLWGDVPALMPFTTRGVKVGGQSTVVDGHKRIADAWRSKSFANQPGNDDSTKHGGDWFSDPLSPGRQGGVKHSAPGPRDNGKGSAWFGSGPASHGSKSTARKMASAMIAKIPLPLAQHIAHVYKPRANG